MLTPLVRAAEGAAGARDLCAACARGLGHGSGSVVEARFARFKRVGDALQERRVLPTPFRGASDAVPRGDSNAVLV